ncbi:MAG: fluoride efflux transporter CrcB [Acidimicrobiales bacterium]
MSAWLWVAIAAAGAIGAPLRYVIDGAVSGRVRNTFPFGTLTVNISGSFVLGLITGLVLYHAFPANGRLIIGVGLVGAYTTFSTFTFETASLIERGEMRLAAWNIAGSVVLGAAAAAAGLALGAI